MTASGKPLVVIDESHHAGIVIVVGTLALIMTLICLAIRVYVRTILSPGFGRDDYLLFVATSFAIIQTSLVMSNSAKGFGTSISLLSSDQVVNVQRTMATTDTLFLITAFLSKCCVLGMLSRLTPQRIHHFILYAIFGLSICWVLSSVLIILVNCELNKPWARPIDHCTGLFQKWEYIGATDSIIELMLFLFSIFLVKSLQMPTSRKIIVLSSFAVRLPLIIFTSLHLYHLKNYAYSTNPTLDIIDSYVWTQMGMNYSLIVCTSFCLAPFMRAISVTYGNAGEVTLGTSSARSKSGKYARDVSKQSQSYALQSMDNQEEIGHSVNNPRHSQPTFVPEQSAGIFNATVSDGCSRRTDGDSVASSESTKMIIKKDVEVTITHEPR
ncbi:uncharacterized protein AKAW2_70156A [Aspergillus luchuensis]|uniref:Uncharacterized protein n=1 Tax=Aspergillus kawachii TaxID=1069201 RepID=A0A7R7X6B7_ASPKA|nr:uncharacterized protein AKAW2_70156A [Aspergillus luchuensis]BCS03278.1 hypothetical protein AKAW2_70156A [Aspergillus luchuensis]BCS14909.1 hypothetical protein ALUC_70142A [Aspergillus luchuensis]GAA84813.1 similar to An16g01900 [Aspergillus luchuensis IFO 4308]